MNALEPQVEAGLTTPGISNSWNRRSSLIHVATVESDGCIFTTAGCRHRTPSDAAKHLVGRPVNEWHVVLLPDGRHLSGLPSNLEAKNQ